MTGHQNSYEAREEDIMALLAAGHSVTTGIYMEFEFKLFYK